MRMESSVLSILVGVSLITCVAAAEKEPSVPAMYVFGDSLADAGNNNYIPDCQFRADFTPYGVSFFPNPTGRFTNGRTTVDFVAARLGLPYPPPYLHPEANFTRGINFASGGSGLLDSTGAYENVLNMSYQVRLFEQYFDRRTYSWSQANLRHSLFCIIVGGNDIISYKLNTTLQKTTTPTQFINLLLAKFDEYIIRLYIRGARKFIVVNIPPVGCIPGARLLGYFDHNGECIDSINMLVESYNTGLNSFVTRLNEILHEVTIIRLNAYDLLLNIIQNGEAYGFNDTKSACCGWGLRNSIIGCGKTIPPDLYCNDTSTYVFWDRIHGTEQVYGMLSEQIWSGNTSVMYPFNLSTLISMHRPSEAWRVHS